MKGKTVIEENFNGGQLCLISVVNAAGITTGRYNVIFNGWSVARMHHYKGTLSVCSTILGEKIKDLGKAASPAEGLELVKRYISDNWASFEFLSDWCTADNMIKTFRRHSHAAKQKECHLDISNLTADTILIYTDLLSPRTKNILQAADLLTLQELTELTRREFLKFRNCGPRTVVEIDRLMEQVGLSWNEQNEEIRRLLKTISNEDLIRECKRRGIISE